MGNARSDLSDRRDTIDDIWWNPRRATMETPEPNHQNVAELKLELERKHEKRRQIIAEKRREMMEMRQALEHYKKENEELKRATNNTSSIVDLKEENEELRHQVEKLAIQLKSCDEVVAKNKELRITLAELQVELQNVNSEMINIEQERSEYAKHVGALKDVIRVTKDMLSIRESQIQELKSKISTVEEILASKEMKIMSDGLREEYERQLRNMRNLRTLYEERQRLDRKDKEKLQEQLDETKKLLEVEEKKQEELQERIAELEADNSKKYDTILSLESNLGFSKAECKELQAEIDVINQLFSQILLGFNNSQEIDLDNLIKTLEENHDLLTNIVANEVSESTAAALPKLLLDLITQINKENVEKSGDENTSHDSTALHQFNSAEEIVENLPKVWKVLIELLSQQCPPSNILSGTDICYKSVETPTGPKLKLSVSQTFIRLKDLIIEKKFLERETYRLKHLNTHLETRLQDQEKRLELVSGELTQTWHVVGKMQRQHQQLHTHEKVLRYELQQKRKLLNELKEDLQYAREKWVLARAKNDTTQEQWKQLRKEFAARKVNDEINLSAESGYSDDKDTSEDERGYESELEMDHDGCANEVEHSLETSETGIVQESDERQTGEVQSASVDDCMCIIEEVIASIGRGPGEFGTSEAIVPLDISVLTIAEAEDNLEATESTSHTLEALASIDGSYAESTSIPLETLTQIPTVNEVVPRVQTSIESMHEAETMPTIDNKACKTMLPENLEATVPITTEDGSKCDIDKTMLPETFEKTVPNTNDDKSKCHKDNERVPMNNEAYNTMLPETLEETLPTTTKDGSKCDIDKTMLPETFEQTVPNTNDDGPKCHKDNEQVPMDNTACNTMLPGTLEETEPTTTKDESKCDIDKTMLPKAFNETVPNTNDDESKCDKDNEQEAQSSKSTLPRTTEEILTKREERLKRLEEQCKQLVTKVTNTSQKSINISNKLDNLHEIYGESSTSNNADEESLKKT